MASANNICREILDYFRDGKIFELLWKYLELNK